MATEPIENPIGEAKDGRPPAYQAPLTSPSAAQIVYSFVKTPPGATPDPRPITTSAPTFYTPPPARPGAGAARFDVLRKTMEQQGNTGSTLDIQLTESNNCEVRRAPRKALKERVTGQLLSQKAIAAKSGLINWKQLEEFTVLARRKLDRVIRRMEGLNEARPSEARTQVAAALQALSDTLLTLNQAASRKDVAALDGAQQMALTVDAQLQEARQLL